MEIMLHNTILMRLPNDYNQLALACITDCRPLSLSIVGNILILHLSFKDAYMEYFGR